MEEESKVTRLEARFGDPSASGKKGVAKREALVLQDLSRTRQYVNALAQPAAEYMGGVLEAELVTGADQLKVTVARDILDRTIGKAPTELRVGPSEQTLDIIRELDTSDEIQ